MKLLALDTSTEYLSLALWIDGETRARDLLAGQQHSQLILPMLAELLRENQLTLSDLDGIAFGAGPGSFTGLRIGMATAKGIAFAAGKPLWAVSSLAALAASCIARWFIGTHPLLPVANWGFPAD